MECKAWLSTQLPSSMQPLIQGQLLQYILNQGKLYQTSPFEFGTTLV